MIGQTLGHYRIEAKLGEGGMGVVYKATDTHLDRPVAIKVLRPEAVANPERKRRFVQEAKAASALNHPSIITIYDIDAGAGTDFIAMEYVPGKTLDQLIGRKGLSLGEALKYAVQIADALAKAHSAGIVHRDLKPANIMVTGDGLIKLLDFGLAKLTERAEGDEFAPTETLKSPHTEEGTIVGTVAYMSPEQAQGKRVDARSDIFSFGSVLYEMVTGRRAFQGETRMSTLSAILSKEPPPTDGTPPELEKIIGRCLRKDPQRRIQHMDDVKLALEELREESGAASGHPTREVAAAPARQRFRVAAITVLLLVLAAAVWWSGVGRSNPIDSLAVLPFVNASGDPNTEYLSEGISESLITSLSRVPRLKVKSRDTVFRYKGQDKDVQEVGRDLGVRAVLKGRLVQRGDSLWISVELVDTRDGTLLWRDQHNRRVADILAIEQGISKEITQQLRLKLTGEEQQRLVRSSTRNPEAHQLYLQGRYFWNRRTEEALKRSIDYFQQSVEKDPGYALAWAGLADSYVVLGILSFMPPADAFPKARAAATRAIELEETLAEPHASLAYLKTLYEWDWPGAEREFQRAVELNPEYGIAHHWYAFYLLDLGRLPEALGEIQRAREVEPLSPIINANVGLICYYARRYEQAIQESRKAIERDPAFHRPHLHLGMVYALQRKQKEATAEFEQALHLSQRGLFELALAGSSLAFLGEREEAQKLLQELLELSQKKYVGAYLPAMIYASMGERDRALEYFEKALQERSLAPDFLRGPLLDGIRSDPRFQSLLHRMGLPP